MRTFLYLLGLGAAGFVGYVLGAKSGRGTYRAIVHTADAVWNDPSVKKARARAKKKARKSLDKATKKLT